MCRLYGGMNLGIAAYGLRVYYSINELSKGLNRPRKEEIMNEKCPVCNTEYEHYEFDDFWLESDMKTFTTRETFWCDECGHEFTVWRDYKLVPQERAVKIND